ncbi:hypothetical protein [Alkalicoccus halolimnae]|uniref:DUF4352 domain-containing protein n=1 Tax=Alkalicoccus halolimnae TaxID=1667239 RepID=A0A5C7FM79_9BACI|nr:hypothetical protein [Alkalicoccus halolimnae]TXF87494.1 hypothetical protein FTX54_01895 [Alkalicoccus halolimnae]
MLKRTIIVSHSLFLITSCSFNDPSDESVAATKKTNIGEQNDASALDIEGFELLVTHFYNSDLETSTSGPVSLHIEKAMVSSGAFKGELFEMFKEESVDYIQVDVWIENTSNEDITFYADSPVIALNTGEQLNPEYLLSDIIDTTMLAHTKRHASLIFIFDFSEVSEIESVRIKWEAPYQEDTMDELGEEIDTTIVFY